MKVNELQIGDYVNYRGQNIKVTSLYDKGGSNEVGWSEKESVWVNASNVEPIPLTPEILEKKGFEKQLGNFVYENEDESLRIEFYPKNINYTNGCYDYIDIERGCVTITEKPIEFVHELQHALRLCGIYKEFEL